MAAALRFIPLAVLTAAFATGCGASFGGAYPRAARAPGGGGEGGRAATVSIPAGQLTAGEWRDLDHWDFWLSLQAEEVAARGGWRDLLAAWGLGTTGRIPLTVEHAGVPVADVAVTLLDAERRPLWRARSDNRGRVELFASAGEGEAAGWLTAQIETEAGPLEVPVSVGEPAVVPINTPSPTAAALDLMLVIDTTGSMSDELRYLQAELDDVIRRVRAEVDGDLDIRTSVNFYRDRGDDYVVREFPFERDLRAVRGQLGEQSADGGGDYPEAVEAALSNAVLEHRWRGSARARLLFLVLDAPPHRDASIVAELKEVTAAAAERGIRIVPVASSGVDQATECLMRSLAIATGGTYVFLTDHSGIGNSHREPTIGPYDVERLNELLVRLVTAAARPANALVAGR